MYFFINTNHQGIFELFSLQNKAYRTKHSAHFIYLYI